MSTIEHDNYTSTEVCDLVGISYRMLDYYIRTAHITIAGDVNGSGNRRYFTQDEVRRLKEVMAMVQDATDILEAFRSGSLWAETT